jgi:hypothetical protein
MFQYIVYYVTICCQNLEYLRPPMVPSLKLFSIYTEKMEEDYPEILYWYSLYLLCLDACGTFFPSLSVNDILWRHCEITDCQISLNFVHSYFKQPVNRSTFWAAR